jgi:hypothetical protein
MLRRLEKRILVPLPNHEARLRMFEHLLTGRVQPEVTFAHMSSKTDGYSGGYVCVRFYGWGWRCGYVGVGVSLSLSIYVVRCAGGGGDV